MAGEDYTAQKAKARKYLYLRAFLVAGARNHRNLPINILSLFSEDTVWPFNVAA